MSAFELPPGTGGGPSPRCAPQARRRPSGVVVVHSDRGAHSRARSFGAVLTAASLQGSMGRVASAGDNAAMECWHALLQKNVLHPRRRRALGELPRSSSNSTSPPQAAAVAA